MVFLLTSGVDNSRDYTGEWAGALLPRLLLGRRAHSRSLGSARDDKKERVLAGKGRLLEERAASNGEGLWRRERAFSINNCPSPSTADHLTIQTVARDEKGESRD
jgi:hypothetical protein